MSTLSPFEHLFQRCDELIKKYLDPIIKAEQDALNSSEPVQVPLPDFDSLAAFRLLSHAELEGYFEAKAKETLKILDQDFEAGKIETSKFASLIFLFILKKQIAKKWTATGLGDDASIKNAETTDFKDLAQQALGYGRQFIEGNNGVKENSIQVLSALMGYFSDELDPVLLKELNLYGKRRGDVAHDSWKRNTRTFESAEIERTRLLTILDLIKNFYESNLAPIYTPRKKRWFSFFKTQWFSKRSLYQWN
ncbi:MAG: hypothetical protein A3I66_17835 [Burkholderiales bacterium RIFCSPLOWO2_02_FULL_57_36]|nr:MAG: hypothetical protein A3I66_17835 [Burkholderiales bacterium RIFCSPLOWO2_02_FULL_57_36]